MTTTPLSLREHLLKSGLAIQSDMLIVNVENGTAISYVGGGNKHFQINYNINVLMQTTSESVNALLFIILQWLHRYHPHAPSDALSFDIDMNNSENADISITVPIEETIQATETDTGTSLKTLVLPEPEDCTGVTVSVSAEHDPQ